ncbi:inositol-pentakisphosphate 2-kinase [Mortierella sp. GBAus27b]|nr:Inositol-pentakisphosphate 2-kinase [Mortierella sp. GBA43]KAI8348900.1 inositol-pentakisphosphate 2-kinase [Mortierella sp. GBAus27b]
MATIEKLYRVEHWSYLAEGNANVVLQYIGPDLQYRSTVLRIRKVDRSGKRSRSGSGHFLGSTVDHVVPKENLSTESLFSSKVIGPLLGQEYVEQLVMILLPTEFLKALAEAIEPFRPSNRLHKGIDCTRTVGFLALDHTQFVKPSIGQPSIAVEIKPKWGFLPQSALIPAGRDIKRRKCRFCMHQHYKVVSGKEKSLSNYCPIDLFSDDEALVQKALEALLQTPQNNMRLFVEGTQQPITKDALMRHCSSEDATALSVSLVDVLTQILVQSPLLKRLGRLQLALDSLDVEGVHQFYAQLVDPVTNAYPEPTIEEYVNTMEAFMRRANVKEMTNHDHDTFVPENTASPGLEPNINLDNLDAIPMDRKLQFIHEFLLSTTLKDCSILIAIRRVNSAEKTIDHVIDLVNGANRSNGVANKLRFREQCRRITVMGADFVYKITCIDLDPKMMAAVPLYLKKDRAIVDHYLATVGDRGLGCGPSSKLKPRRGSKISQ